MPHYAHRHWLVCVLALLTLLTGVWLADAAVSFPLPIPTRPTSFPLARPAQLGKVIAWGDNSYGETNVPAGLTGVVAVAAQYYRSLALKQDGTVIAWGDNASYGPTYVPQGLTGVVAVTAGYHNMALKDDGTVVAWGYNGYGETNVPAGLTGAVAIAEGAFFSVALKQDGTVVAWGNSFGGESTVPAGLSNIVAISAGSEFTLGLKQDGTVVAWGYNSIGQTNVPVGLTGVVAIAGGQGHGLALKQDGTVVAWGANGSGQANVPSGLSNVVAIAAGNTHSVAVKQDGTVFCWGSQTTVPQGLTNVVAAAAGFHSLALVANDVSPAAPPVITLQPRDQTNLVGTTAILNVSVGGTWPFAYQWAFNGTNISGATSSSLVITNIQLTNDGYYSVVVANSAGYTNSTSARLTVLAPASISVQPQGESAFWGRDATLHVTATGWPPVSYQWFKDGLAISWATNATLLLTNLEMTAAGNYTVTVSNSLQSVTSSPIVLVVNPAGISLGLYPGLTVDGVAGKTYGIQCSTNVNQVSSWTTVTSLTLTQAVQLWIDTNVNTTLPEPPRRFYRVVPIP